MDDKTFKLLEEMYSDLSKRIDKMENNLKRDNVKLENKIDQNHKALYDGYKLTYEKLGILEEKVSEINRNVERQDLEIRVIKSVK